MLSNYFTLQALTTEAAATLKEADLVQAFTQDRAEAVLTFARLEVALILSCRPESSTFFFHPGFQRAKRNTTNIFPECLGKTITEVSLDPSDRILTITLDNADRIVAQFFGPASNILLVSPGDVIRDAFQKRTELVDTPYSHPPRERIVDLQVLHELPKNFGGITILAAIRKTFPLFAQPLAEELLFRSEVDGSLLASQMTPRNVLAVSSTMQQMLIELQRPDPRVYIDEESHRTVLSVIPLTSLGGLLERRFSSTSEAVRFVVARRRADHALEQRRSALIGHIRQVIERSRRSLDAAAADGRNAERADDYARYGEILMTHAGALHRGDASASIAVDGATVTIPLDPRLSQIQNAQRYFDKAKRSRTAAAESAARRSDLENRIAAGETLLAALAEASTMSDLKQMMTERADDLEEFGIGEKGETTPLPFRRFIVDGGFEVLAGKSSENNDELTLRVAKPQDLWFHARGSSGSHVVLRVSTGKGEPGKRAREQAAAIAAYYSKMKTAGLVPVAMTEKKYVRKPRGAKAGSVVLEREKVIFVRPGLPDAAPHTKER